MRRRLLGETHHPIHVRPLNDSKAIDAGANFISESEYYSKFKISSSRIYFLFCLAFLFIFAASLILAETTRSRIAEGKRRDAVLDTLESHAVQLQELETKLDESKIAIEEGHVREEKMAKIVEEIVGIGLRGGWLQDALTLNSDWEERDNEAKKGIDFAEVKVEGSTRDEEREEGKASEGSSTPRHDEVNSSNYT